MNFVLKTFISDWHVYIILALMFAVMYLAFTRPRADGKSWLSQLFTTNDELDSTLNVILKGFTVLGVFVIVFAMVVAFHDDIKDKAGMVIISAIGMISLAMRDMFPNGTKKQ